MRRFYGIVLLLLLFGSVGCSQVGQMRPENSPRASRQTLTEARRGFKTDVPTKESAQTPAPMPPPNLLRRVRYPSPVGKLSAYLTPLPTDGKKHPAIIWITGGDCNTIDEGIWSAATPENDQTAQAFRNAKIVTMYPSLRGGCNNPGYREGFYGEVEDVLSAREYLAQQPGVDPKRIYLGGHSTGGTLALLVAELSPRFRAVFSFGPVDDVAGYGDGFLPAGLTDRKELDLRSPGLWLNSIQSPTFVFEGDGGNIESLRAMSQSNQNRRVRFFALRGADHFNILAPTTKRLARKIAADKGGAAFTFSGADLNRGDAP